MTSDARDPRQHIPKRVAIGANAHAALAEGVQRVRPDLELRGAKYMDLTDADMAWADTYLGFRKPPTATLGNVRWVHSTGAGVDPWFFPTEISRDILLTRSSESFGPMIAEWALSRALSFTQHIVALANSQKAGKWEPQDVTLLRGTTAVVVGTGDVGANVAKVFAALGCIVIGVSRSGHSGDDVFSRVESVANLKRVVAEAQWLVVTVPLTDATRGMISRDVLQACRGAVLINSGRGAVVEESAVVEALDAGWLKGAALDVFVTEPLPASSPLWTDHRVMVSPHISGLTTIDGAVAGFLECIETLERGEFPKWTVDRVRQY